MKRLVLLACLLAGMRPAHADATEPTTPPPSAVAETQRPKRSRTAKWLAAGSLLAIHGSYLTWQYFAWYRKGSQDFHVAYDPGFSFAVGAYSGGADKLGHLWGNYAITRGTTAILVEGGWPKLPSSAVAFGLTQLAYTLIEIQDGMAPWGFDPKDYAANLIGGALGVVMDNVPALDRYLDFRLEYWPSGPYRENFSTRGLNGAQDYTGQSYLVALHLGAVPGLATADWGYWSRFVDVAVGFEAKHYYPTPDPLMPRQTLYAGLAINMQGVLSHLFDDSAGRRIGRGLFEAYSLPFTTFRFVEASRSP